jgi:hypothetical protein
MRAHTSRSFGQANDVSATGKSAHGLNMASPVACPVKWHRCGERISGSANHWRAMDATGEADVGLAQGNTVPEVVRKLGVTEQTYCR